MRHSSALFVVALLLAASGLAAQEERRFVLFAGLEPGASYSDAQGLDFETAYVFGFDTYVAPRWAAEFAVSFQRDSRSGGAEDVSAEATSVDAAARFDFLRRGRWGLHGLGGLRYSENRSTISFDVPPGPRRTDSFSADRTGVLLGLGADLDLTRRLSLRLDAKHVPWILTGDDMFGDDSTLSAAFAFEF